MKIWIMSSKAAEIKDYIEWGIVSGVAINQHKVEVIERNKIDKVCAEIAQVMPNSPISIGLYIQTNYLITNAKKVLEINCDNIIVQVPIDQENIKLIPALKNMGLTLNISFIKTPKQLLLATIFEPDYITIPIGQLIDDGWNPNELIATARKIVDYSSEKAIKIVAGGVYHSQQAIEAAKAGAHISMMTPRAIDTLLNISQNQER